MGQRKYPPLTPSEVIEIVLALGFRRKGQCGSHEQYYRMKTSHAPASLVTVDTHYDQFDDDRIKQMIRQSNHTRDQFYGATKKTARKAGVGIYVVPSEA